MYWTGTVLVVSHTTGGGRARELLVRAICDLTGQSPQNIIGFKRGGASFHVAKMECWVEWRLALVILSSAVLTRLLHSCTQTIARWVSERVGE